MLYKITSTVKARFDDNGDIISPTQSLLEDGILKTSKYIPKDIRNNVVDAKLSVDKNSVCKNGVCGGDIYVETKKPLNVLEQRKLVDGMTYINKEKNDAIMMPICIRNSPTKIEHLSESSDKDLHFTKRDDNWPDTYPSSLYDSAFLCLDLSISFGHIAPKDVESTYVSSQELTSNFNRSLNSSGLKTIYADASVSDVDQDKTKSCFYRNGGVILKKTANYDATNNLSDILTKCNTVFETYTDTDPSRMLHVTGISDASANRAIIGSLPLKNTQLANETIRDMTSYIENNNDLDIYDVCYNKELFRKSMKNNPLYVNGFSNHLTKKQMHVYDKLPVLFSHCDPGLPSSENKRYSEYKTYEMSTRQSMPKIWKEAPAFNLNLSCDKSLMDKLIKPLCLKEIVTEMNEYLGSDENKPLIKDILKGPRVDMDEEKGLGFSDYYRENSDCLSKSGQNLMLLSDKNQMENVTKHEIQKAFATTLSNVVDNSFPEYADSFDPHITVMPTPYFGDIEMCKVLQRQESKNIENSVSKTQVKKPSQMLDESLLPQTHETDLSISL